MAVYVKANEIVGIRVGGTAYRQNIFTNLWYRTPNSMADINAELFLTTFITTWRTNWMPLTVGEYAVQRYELRAFDTTRRVTTPPPGKNQLTPRAFLFREGSSGDNGTSLSPILNTFNVAVIESLTGQVGKGAKGSIRMGPLTAALVNEGFLTGAATAGLGTLATALLTLTVGGQQMRRVVFSVAAAKAATAPASAVNFSNYVTNSSVAQAVGALNSRKQKTIYAY